MVWLLQKTIRLYQLILSPWLGTRCRFTPSCSEYTDQALKQYGVRKGLSLALKRLLKCHPWGASGYDPVPTSQTDLTKTRTRPQPNSKRQ